MGLDTSFVAERATLAFTCVEQHSGGKQRPITTCNIYNADGPPQGAIVIGFLPHNEFTSGPCMLALLPFAGIAVARSE
jgi:hypothetical protein